MSNADWSEEEVGLIVEDYFSMLASELAGTPYNKTAHRLALLSKLPKRSETAIEYKHGNISAVLTEAGFPSINGYKPYSGYQALLANVILNRLQGKHPLLELAASDVDRPIAVPEIDDILSILVKRSLSKKKATGVKEKVVRLPRALHTNYLEREARNQSLGLAGELLILKYERERLIRAGKEKLANKIEHTSDIKGDGEGFDILSFEPNGAERLIEVKTTKYSGETPFFVTRNELATSKALAPHYHVYRLFTFREAPKLFMLSGAIDLSCEIAPATYLARPN
jgi:hypothetical protein